MCSRNRDRSRSGTRSSDIGLAEHVLAPVTGELLRRRVELHQAAIGVHGEHGDGRPGDQRAGQRLPLGQRGHVVGVPDLGGHDGGHGVRGGPHLVVPARHVADQGQSAQALPADRHRTGQQHAVRRSASRPRAWAPRRARCPGEQWSARRSWPAAPRPPSPAGAWPARRAAGSRGWKASAARRPNALTSRASTAGSAPSAVSSRRICATAKSSTAAADPPVATRSGSDLARGAPMGTS